MIKIFKSEEELGYALFDPETNKFLYGEICDKKRLRSITNSFPDEDVIIYVEKEWQDELQDIFFLIPHLQDLAQIKVLRKFSVAKMLSEAGKTTKKKSNTFVYVITGIVLGALLLLPTSREYKDSVLIKAKVSEEIAHEFVDSQPELQLKQQLYTSLNSLYRKVNVEAITYVSGTYTIIFSSSNPNIVLEDLEGFQDASFVKSSSLKGKDGEQIHIYQLEGSI